ncbi:hypothetical protein ANTPLA_LOCUS5208 [Anthophora plagiata]
MRSLSRLEHRLFGQASAYCSRPQDVEFFGIREYRFGRDFFKSSNLSGRKSSVSGGQGYQRCVCKGQCKSNKCKCKKSGKLCNSKCHNSLICLNK